MLEKRPRRPRIPELAAIAAVVLTPANAADAGKKAFDSKTSHSIERVSSPEEIQEPRLDTSHNLLSEEDILRDRDDAVAYLVDTLPPNAGLENLADTELLKASSEAYAPDETERRDVAAKSESQLDKLMRAIPPNGYGLFAFADLDPHGSEHHRLYVLHRDPAGIVQFVKAYRISMAENGFGDEKDSGKTPLGLSYIQSGYEGMLGEVVTAKDDKSHYFKRIVKGKNGKLHRFVSDFTHENILEPSSVITARYTIDETRGIHMHGTNRSGRWHIRNGQKVWQSFIDGELARRSGACLRMDNASIANLRRYVRMPMLKKGTPKQKGTPVYIHATPEVLQKRSLEK